MSWLPSGQDLKVLWDFSRPHTIIGSVLAVLTFYLVACHESGLQDLGLFLIVLGASLGVNLYIVGLNQLTDVDIDRVNKPHLPLPSGRLSAQDGARIVAVAGVLALGLAPAGGRWLMFTIGTVFVMGTLYSLPPARLKRFPIAAAISIVGARGIIGNLGLWLSFEVGLTGSARVPSHLLAFVLFMVGFMTVISLLKDIPDVSGDEKHEIRTFSVRLGGPRILAVCVGILSTFYAGMIVLGALGAPGLHGTTTVVVHGVLVVALWLLARRVDVGDQATVTRFYMNVWALYYLEFGAYLLACLRS